MIMPIIDSHMHCGIQNVSQPIEMIADYLEEAGLRHACLFAPVEDVYDRLDSSFVDSSIWRSCRQRANDYLLEEQRRDRGMFAYYFVWNDFKFEELSKGYKGVKWHRHSSEPTYNYEDPRCEEFLQEVYRLSLPIVLEETFENTLKFVKRVNGRTPIIIPHLGFLNGGFSDLVDSEIWEEVNIYGDTALSSLKEMKTFIKHYGCEKLIFGSDFPFGNPRSELNKVKKLGLDENEFGKVSGGNIARLIGLD